MSFKIWIRRPVWFISPYCQSLHAQVDGIQTSHTDGLQILSLKIGIRYYFTRLLGDTFFTCSGQTDKVYWKMGVVVAKQSRALLHGMGVSQFKSCRVSLIFEAGSHWFLKPGPINFWSWFPSISRIPHTWRRWKTERRW